MKKHFILPVVFALVQITSCFAIPSPKDVRIVDPQPDSLTAYTGKYRMQQGPQTIYMEIYVENGKLTGKDLTNGAIKTLDHLSGDDFILSKEKVPVKFIRNTNNKVFEIAVMGNVMWAKVDSKSVSDRGIKLTSPEDYIGKYQVKANGQTLVIEISLKNGQLLATQLWDGASSTLGYISDDEFMVNALNMKMKFVRDADKHITQLLLNGTDVFTKVKN